MRYLMNIISIPNPAFVIRVLEHLKTAGGLTKLTDHNNTARFTCTNSNIQFMWFDQR